MMRVSLFLIQLQRLNTLQEIISGRGLVDEVMILVITTSALLNESTHIHLWGKELRQRFKGHQ
jgi:hypothetical protein